MVRTTTGTAEKPKTAKAKVAPVTKPAPEQAPVQQAPVQPIQTLAGIPGGAYHSGMANDPSLKS